MINQAIYKILGATNLFDLADELEKFITISNTINKEKSQHYDMLREALTNKLISLHDKYRNDNDYPYLLLNDSDAISTYLFGEWCGAKGYRNNREKLMRIISRIREDYLEEKCIERFPEEIIRPIFTLVNSRFNFCEKVKAADYIRVLCLNHTNKDCPSYYSHITSGDGEILFDYIALCDTTRFRKNDLEKFNCSFTFLFLHELGHMVNAYATGDVLIVPNKFEKLVSDIISITRVNILAYKPINEIFCDLFAIAATYVSEFHDEVVLNQYIKPEAGVLIIKYMSQLINEIGKRNVAFW